MTTNGIPDGLQRYFDKGVQAYTQGSYLYAIDLLTHVVKQAPAATEARRQLRLAIQQYYLQQPPSLLTRVGLWVFSLPIYAWAMICGLQGQYQRAIHVYEWLLRLQPRSHSLLVGLATTLNLAGLDEAAVTTYEELLQVAPNHLPALRHFARLAMKRGLDAKARQCFERVLTLAPGDLEAQQGLRNLDALGTIKKGFAS